MTTTTPLPSFWGFFKAKAKKSLLIFLVATALMFAGSTLFRWLFYGSEGLLAKTLGGTFSLWILAIGAIVGFLPFLQDDNADIRR